MLRRSFVCPVTLSFMKFFWFCAVLALLFLMTVFDIRNRRIPDGLILLLVLAGVPLPGILSAARLGGALIVSLPLLAAAVFIPGSFGGGDVKLMAAAGWLLGVQLIWDAFVCGMMAAGGFCLILLLSGKAKGNTKIPLAPFLCAGIAITIFFNDFV